VETSSLIQGRWWTQEQIEAIRRLIAGHPGWSRNRLSIALSEQLAWRTATGQLRDMAARHLLNKLAARGWIELPPRQRRGGKRTLRVLREEAELFAMPELEPIAQNLQSLRPLEILLIGPRHPAAADFVRHLARHHYLGFGGETGAHLRYLMRDRFGRDLACAIFGAAAWQVRARDAFIGWSATQRRERLGSLVNNTRFLILPHVQVAHLASHILGRLLRRLPEDWQRKYAIVPCLAETFVERGRFAGVCYQAANWQCVGQSCGRSRGDRAHRLQVPIKDIYLYPLRADFRQRLCAGA
jgi:uncharacterized protein DUF4338